MQQQKIDWILFWMVKAMHMQITARDLEDIVARYNHKPDASCSSWWKKTPVNTPPQRKHPGCNEVIYF